MANYAQLKAAIDQVIKANGQQEITGPVLNQVLKAMVDSLGAGYILAGVATPSTNPGTPDQDVYWLAYQGGTYTNFGGAQLPTGISMLKWNGSWTAQTFFTVDDQLTPNSNNLAKSGAAFDAVMQSGVFDLSAYNSGAKYADLSAALTALNSLPAAYKRGGMSMKFVQSSDNNYVQYRFMLSGSFTDAQFTAYYNWQGVDDEPTTGTNNLVKSSGTKQYIDKRTVKENGNIVIYPVNKCYDENGELKSKLTWTASALINVDEVLNSSVVLSSAAQGNEANNISSVVFYNSTGEYIGNLFTTVSSIAKSSMPQGTKYIAFSFYNKSDVRISDYSFEDKITKLHELNDGNVSAIKDIKEEIGLVENYPSTLSVNSSSTQYLCNGVAVDADVIKILVTTDAVFASGKRLYYNIQFGDNTWRGEQSILTGSEYTIDSNGKKFKSISIYCPKNTVETAGSANVRITADGIKRDIFIIKSNIDAVESEIDAVESEITEELGIINNYLSTLQVSSSVQYLCSNVAIDADKVKILVTLDAVLVNGRGFYYNIQFGDNSYSGETLFFPNNEIEVNSSGKKFKNIVIYCIANSVVTSGEANVRITTDGIKRDILDINTHLEEVDSEIAELQPSAAEYWVSDNLWDANHLFNGYLMTNSDTGVPIANYEWRMTDYLIPVIAGAKVYLRKIGTTTNSTFTVAEYDSNKDFIKRDSQKQQAEYTVPSDVAYIKISVYKGHVNNGQDYPNFPLYSIQSYREIYLCSDYNPPYGVYPNLRQGTKLQGKKIAYFGDSIIGFGNVCKYLKNYIGAAEVYNVGFGGCRMAAHDENYGAFSMYNLAAAIVSGDYSTQIAALPHTSLGLNGTLSLNNLTTIDWTTIDIILVHYGSNDWTSGVINIGVGDITDTRDFKGMMEKSIQTILTAYPKIKIVFDTLLWRDVTTIPSEVTGTDFITATNRKGNTPADFNNAIKEVCAKYYLDCNDVTFGLFNSYNKTTYLQDSAHPNDRGWQLMAEKVANLL